MSRPVIRFHDPRAGVLAILRERFPALRFGTKRWDEYPAEDVPALPYALVASDGTFVRQTVTSTATVRVAVWADDDAEAYDLAEDIHAGLLAYEGGPAVRGCGPMSGPLPTVDPDTNRPMTFFTVRARLCPRTD